LLRPGSRLVEADPRTSTGVRSFNNLLHSTLCRCARKRATDRLSPMTGIGLRTSPVRISREKVWPNDIGRKPRDPKQTVAFGPIQPYHNQLRRLESSVIRKMRPRRLKTEGSFQGLRRKNREERRGFVVLWEKAK
jgi:hypothetical protein